MKSEGAFIGLIFDNQVGSKARRIEADWASDSDRGTTSILEKLCLTCDTVQAKSLQHQCGVWWLDEFQNAYRATT
jgi:hypothetical protein